MAFRRAAAVRNPLLVSLAGLLAAQALFWTFTYPANVATLNWTVMPEDWERLRRAWEYSHAAGALSQMTGFVALAIALINWRRSEQRPIGPGEAGDPG